MNGLEAVYLALINHTDRFGLSTCPICRPFWDDDPDVAWQDTERDDLEKPVRKKKK